MNYPALRINEQTDSIVVSDPTFKRRALENVIQSLRAGERSNGLSMEVKALLTSSLKEKDWPALLETCSVHITFDKSRLRKGFAAMRTFIDDYSMFVCLIQAHAGDSLLKALFPQFSRSDMATLRRDLQITAPNKAQPLTAAEMVLLREVWPAIQQQYVDLRRRYLALHRNFPQHTLYSLFAAINDLPSTVRRSSPQTM